MVQSRLSVKFGRYLSSELAEVDTLPSSMNDPERLDLVKLLRIYHPYEDDTWSAMDICDGWARKRGYSTAKAARLDSYRAANSLLRMALDGKICLCLRPPHYLEKKDFWMSHPDIETVRWIQARPSEKLEAATPYVYKSSDESEEDIPRKEGSDTSEQSNEAEGTSMGNKFAALATDE